METPRPQKFLIVEDDNKNAQWLQHSVGSGWPAGSIVIMDWASFGRVRTAMTVRDYDIVMLALDFPEGIEDPHDSFDWIRKLRSQPGFPEMIVLGTGGSELAAIRALRLGAADYLPKRLLTPTRVQRSIKVTLRAIDKEAQRRAERLALAAKNAADGKGAAEMAATTLTGAQPVVPVTPTANGPAAGLNAQISTQTGATLAKAAQVASAPKPAGLPARPAANGPAHIATQTGKTLAQAAQAVVRPASAAAPVSAADTHKDPAAQSLPAIAVSQPGPVKEAKTVAPQIHFIPGYTILQKIGESEAAAVYLAIAEDLNHNVALKISKRKHAVDGAIADTGQRSIMFQREFEAIAALDHPSIIDLFDYGIHEGVEYLAMEYFPCGDLKARLQNPLTADEAIAFLKEIALSLRVVHEAGIIHRDLKPPNVMLRDDGSVVLIDFGLARSLLGGDGSTRTGVLRGSPYYMSPEQAQGESLDARTDIYSLGVILYEMLAGKKPYLGASAIDVLQQHVMAPVPELPVHQLFYQPLLERLMSKSREQRIASCDELLSALEQMSNAMGESSLIDPATLVSAGSAP
jgi:tRNA A-37 threonylcarbamoyl transferase component Bud32/ActR/RegA family two-component response regulator